jgi:hypothetical protein
MDLLWDGLTSACSLCTGSIVIAVSYYGNEAAYSPVTDEPPLTLDALTNPPIN